MDRKSTQRASQQATEGLTLIELMIVVAILGVLLFAGVPSFHKALQKSRVESEAHRLMRAIIFTRSEAVRRNTPVSMCPSQMFRTGLAECGGTFATGWIVFQNGDKDKIVDSEDEVVRIYEAMPQGLTLTNRAGTRQAREIITYKTDGTSGRVRTLLVCAGAGNSVPPKSVIMSNVGRPRIATGWGTCPSA